MPDKPPFNLLRAAFYLLAAVVLVVMFETLMVVMGCIWSVSIMQQAPIGACSEVGSQIREIVSEMLTAILALLVARSPKE